MVVEIGRKTVNAVNKIISNVQQQKDIQLVVYDRPNCLIEEQSVPCQRITSVFDFLLARDDIAVDSTLFLLWSADNLSIAREWEAAHGTEV